MTKVLANYICLTDSKINWAIEKSQSKKQFVPCHNHTGVSTQRKYESFFRKNPSSKPSMKRYREISCKLYLEEKIGNPALFTGRKREIE